MKIFWKLFFSMAIVMIVTFCIAGYVMISAFFESSYRQAGVSAEEINRMFLRAFGNYMGTVSGQKTDTQGDIEALAGEYLGKDTRVRIVDKNNNILYADFNIQEKDTLTGRRLIKSGKNYYIQVAKWVKVGKKQYYAMTSHDMTAIFAEREEQLSIYRRILLYLPGICGMVSLFLSGLLVRPIRKISRGARLMADGELNRRICIKSQDEIGEMADDFNRMADSLQGKIVELEEASRRQKEFIGSFAHELKTPLTSIIGYADLLRSGIQTEEENFFCANYIFQEGRRLERLSLRLMDLIVLEKKELQQKDISLASFFEDVEESMKPIMEKENIEFECSCTDCSFMAEAGLLKTVCINLIDNARKAVAGKEDGHIRLVGKKSGEYICIGVEDNGGGIPEEELGRITEAFYMVDKSRSRKQGGAGLGLSICERIVSLHGGRMLFECGQEGGLRVVIQLPAQVV